MSIAPPTRVTIDLDAIAHNYKCISDFAIRKQPATIVVPCVKGDAYGHGAAKVAAACVLSGATYIAVASLHEAQSLRSSGITVPILVMSYVPSHLVAIAAKLDIRVTVYDRDWVEEAATTLRDAGEVLAVHAKVDTGMGRLGVLPENVGTLAEGLAKPCFDVEGILTHFSCADENEDFTQSQIHVFNDAVAQFIRVLGSEPKYIHCCNSAATLNNSMVRGNMMRVGLALYGCEPSALLSVTSSDTTTGDLPTLKPAMKWTTTIAQVKELPAGHAIGYGNTYTTSAAEKVAMVPVGYADGFRRGPQNQGVVLIQGQRCPIRGRVSMEKTVVSVQHLPTTPKIGDEVVLLGQQGEEWLRAEEIAKSIGSSNYEVLCSVAPRQSREEFGIYGGAGVTPARV